MPFIRSEFVYIKEHLCPILSNMNPLNNLTYTFSWSTSILLSHLHLQFPNILIPEIFLKTWCMHFLFCPKHDTSIVHLIYLQFSSLTVLENHWNLSPKQSLKCECYITVPNKNILHGTNINQSCMTWVILPTLHKQKNISSLNVPDYNVIQ